MISIGMGLSITKISSGSGGVDLANLKFRMAITVTLLVTPTITPTGNFLLLENGDFLLLESGDKIIL